METRHVCKVQEWTACSARSPARKNQARTLGVGPSAPTHLKPNFSNSLLTGSASDSGRGVDTCVAVNASLDK